jgi:hypothetical protein
VYVSRRVKADLLFLITVSAKKEQMSADFYRPRLRMRNVVHQGGDQRWQMRCRRSGPKWRMRM